MEDLIFDSFDPIYYLMVPYTVEYSCAVLCFRAGEFSTTRPTNCTLLQFIHRAWKRNQYGNSVF